MDKRYDDEIEYWRATIAGLTREEDSIAVRRLRAQLGAPTPLDARIAAELPPSDEDWRILDVGCGPMTALGRRVGDRTLSIVGVDPLAGHYQRMLAEAGVEPPFESRTGLGEDVDRMFPHDHFDLVYSCNALDHSQDPSRAIRSMIHVAKPGAAIWITVYRNEAINAAYSGLHSWNFDQLHDTLVVWNPGGAQLLEQVVDGLPCKWNLRDADASDAQKSYAQEFDIVVYKDGTDLAAMTPSEGGVYAAVTGRGAFVTLWAPADLDERYNFFIHGYDRNGTMVLNRALRWYNGLRRRSVAVAPELDAVYFQFGQFEVHLEGGRPRYENLWLGKLSRPT